MKPDNHPVEYSLDRGRDSVVRSGSREIRQTIRERTADAEPRPGAANARLAWRNPEQHVGAPRRSAGRIHVRQDGEVEGDEVFATLKHSTRSRVSAGPHTTGIAGSAAPVGLETNARLRLEEVSRATSKPIGDTYLGLAYYYTGSSERARTLLESLTGSGSASTAARAGAALAGILGAQGETAAARSRIENVLSRGYRDHHVAYSLGAAYAQLNETKAAYAWLRTAADTGFPCLPFFERDPLLAPLRSQSACAQLLEYVRTRRQMSLSDHQ